MGHIKLILSIEKDFGIQFNGGEVVEMTNYRRIREIVQDKNKSAVEAKKSIKKTSEGIEKVTNKIKDGKGSFLSRIVKMNKLGGLFPKKQLSSDIIDEENPDDDPPAGGVSGKISMSNEEKKAVDLIADKKK